MTVNTKGKITVDRDFARFGEKAYAINKINTVEVRTEPPNRMAAFLLIVIGSVTGILSLTARGGPGAGLFVGIVLIAIGAVIYRQARATYRLFLMTSSSEVQAYSTQDLTEVTDLRRAVEGAMTARERRIGSERTGHE